MMIARNLKSIIGKNTTIKNLILRGKYMVEYAVPERGYNLIYHEYDCNECNCNGGIMKELIRYELTDNNKLWLVKATYAKSLSLNKYYIVATNSKDAKNKFKSIYTWLNVITSVELVEGDLLEFVLTHPMNVCLR